MSTERINKGFSPNIAKLVSTYPMLHKLERWGIESQGQPIPTDRNLNGALWRGIFSKLGEVPVIVLIAPSQRDINTYGRWFVGATDENTLNQSNDRTLTLVDCAEYHAPDLESAIELLENFTPLHHFPDL